MPTLRVHFTPDDLTRVRIAQEPDPLWEIVLSLHRLRGPAGAPVFTAWRRKARTRIGPAVKMLLPLVPPTGYFADFLTPAESAAGLEHGIEAVMSTPRARVRTDLARLTTSAQPEWVTALAAGGAAAARAMTLLGNALRDYYNAVVAPDLPLIRAHVESDRARRVRAVLAGGCEALLLGLRPLVRWQPPVLYVDYPVDQDLHLNGRGLLLVPSFFCSGRPVTLLDADLPPVLIYAVDHDVPSSDDQVLGSLLGRTRAALLRRIDATCTTTELARWLEVSPASVSQHTAVLRNAGLISTRRDGGSVLHSLTPLGIALLSGDVSRRSR
jgi:DNA-binding transcriptional ArsR family regulator